MNNRHAHADMIIAKAENMNLVSFCKPRSETKWQEMSRLNFPDFGGSHDYFLCLPQHNEERSMLTLAEWWGGCTIERTKHKAKLTLG